MTHTDATYADPFDGQDRQTRLLDALREARRKLERLDRQKHAVMLEIGTIMRAAREHNSKLATYRGGDRVDVEHAAAVTGLSRPTLYKWEKTPTVDTGRDPSMHSSPYLAELYDNMGDDYPDVADELRTRYPHIATIEALMSIVERMWMDDHPEVPPEDVHDILGPRHEAAGLKYLARVRQTAIDHIKAGPLADPAW